MDFVVLSCPILLAAILGFIYLYLYAGERRTRKRIIPVPKFSDPVITRSPLGIISIAELMSAALFIIFLTWTYYSRISNDFKKMTPNKSLHLNVWQYKLMRIGIRLGSLSEACLALLLLPILRGMSLFQLLGLQFEASVRYHIWLGNAMMLFSTLHGVITMFIWAVKKKLGYQLLQWQITGRVNLAGEIALVTGLIIWITSLPQIRRKRFELFYYTHHLYAIFIIFFLFHGGDRHFYTVFSGVVLFALDKLLRVIQSRQVTCLLSARLLPCKAVELTFSKHPGLKYNPTSMIFINIPSISTFQWHPFSLTSSSSADNDTISVISKCQGQWSNELYNMIDAAVTSDADNMKHIPIAVEGPYGPSSIYYQRYDSLLLIAGGIGITPFISILREVDSRNKNSKSTTRMQLIYVVKTSHDLSMLNSVSAHLLNQLTGKGYLKLKMFVTQEEECSTSVRDLLQEMSQVRRAFFNTKHSNYTMPRPASLVWKATIVGIFAVVFMASLVCLNHWFLPTEKPTSKKKIPSWISDVTITCSFIIATFFSTLATILLRWKQRKSEALVVSQEKAMGTEQQSVGVPEEHEIHFGQRPNFEDIFSKFPIQMEGSQIGVLVCGPDSMQQSVAWCCKHYSKSFKRNSKMKKASFSYHSLSFSL
ncbi:ferric reduction oxidase 8, mitochondrial [Cinnamomum micranthum f. kanehirae]|uniref:Ferric reduction oxidase 8, mitochondrial n=1 Tax=Cinnamomum micranthum f. kanehirae TaxID=337451 RepID=A0A443NNI8_9MAGN|nr:ferric reduction oxidase 8, mitochondrial [Cinnamomum micranthum f. kanehirae]